MKNHYRSIRAAFFLALSGLLAAGFSSCGVKDHNSPGVEFMPDMYRSPSLEYYQTHTVDGDTVNNAMHPVSGTIARGYMPYVYPNTPEGYEAAGLNLKNPLAGESHELALKQGEELYLKFCVHCHGASGAGDGKVGGKLPGAPPAYNGALKTLPEGKIFHSVTYGKGLMGPHNTLLSTEERWKVVLYVQKLQNPDGAPAADSTAAAGASAPTATAGAAGTATAPAENKKP